MRILFLSTSDLDGGAARAAFRLHMGLRESGIDVQMLVQKKMSETTSVIGPGTRLAKVAAPLRQILEREFCRRTGKDLFSAAILPSLLYRSVAKLSPDLIHLHWVNDGLLRPEALHGLSRPFVWTLHDMWPFTGGCHYSGECTRYSENCGNCPMSGNGRDRDRSRRVWMRKNRSYKGLQLTVVTPSRWLAECARASSLFQDFRTVVIPNGIDLRRYKPMDRRLARELLGLPGEKPLVLFGAMNAIGEKRKGFHLLQAAIARLSATGWKDRLELAVMGATAPEKVTTFGLQSHYLGRLHDEVSIALVFAAADVFVAPSIQDNLPNTIMEAMACGTPCVAFNVGGIPDMIEHQVNGWLARPYEPDDLARGIAWILGDDERQQNLSVAARGKVQKEFAIEAVAARYNSLYEEILAK